MAFTRCPPSVRTTDYESLLRQPRLDAVDIVTPDALHAPMMGQALETGLHVFVEKPLATSYTAALALSGKAGVRISQAGPVYTHPLR